MKKSTREVIRRLKQTLGFNPRTANPATCWPWPGTVQSHRRKLVPVLRITSGVVRPLRYLVEHVNRSPLPVHPHTGKHVHIVRPCRYTPLCVNPYHARLQKLTDLWEVEIDPYQQQKYLFADEYQELAESLDHDEDALRALAPLNFPDHIEAR